MKALILAVVSALAVTVVEGQQGKSDQSVAVHDVEIIMKKDANCKWPPFASAFIHNNNAEARIPATVTVTNNPARSDELNPGETKFLGCWSPSDPNNPGYAIVDAIYF